jgi:hypothetical protein
MEEAWERQRRRRLAFAWTVCAVLAAALVVAILRPGLPFLGPHAGSSSPATAAAIAVDVDQAITAFDTDLATGQYAAACSLLAPVVGTADLRADTDAVGIHGTCAQRLAGFARIVGPRVLSEVNPAFEQALMGDPRSGIQYGRNQSGGFDAYAGFAIGDPNLYPNLTIQNVEVERANRDAPVLITSPPLLGAGPWGQTFLAVYIRNKKLGLRPPALAPISE